PPADDLSFTNYYGANGYLIIGQSQFSFTDGLVHKKIIWGNSRLITKINIPHYISLLPFGTGFSIAAKTISPFSSAKPVSKNSEIKFAICFFGKLMTPKICLPGSSSLV